MPEVTSLRAVIIDDETLSREKIVRYLREVGNVEIAGEAATAAEGRKIILERKPHLAFVDVRLPDSDGLSMADALQRELGPETPHFIVSTAYDSHALRAFDVHAVDYLVKPYSRERFQSALQHAASRSRLSAHGSTDIASEDRNISRRTDAFRAVLKSNGKLLVFDTREILYLYAADNYVQVHARGERHLIRAKLSDIEGQLERRWFLRTHRCVVVNLRHVREVNFAANLSDLYIVMTNGSKVPLSRNYRAQVLSALGADSLLRRAKKL